MFPSFKKLQYFKTEIVLEQRPYFHWDVLVCCDQEICEGESYCFKELFSQQCTDNGRVLYKNVQRYIQWAEQVSSYFRYLRRKHTGNSNWRSAKCTNQSYWLQHAQPQCVLWLADTDSYVLSIQPWVPKGCCPTFNLSGRKACRCTSNHQVWHYLQNLFRSVNRLSVTIFLSQIMHISWMLVIVHKISVVCCFACGTAWDGSWR